MGGGKGLESEQWRVWEKKEGLGGLRQVGFGRDRGETRWRAKRKERSEPRVDCVPQEKRFPGRSRKTQLLFVLWEPGPGMMQEAGTGLDTKLLLGGSFALGELGILALLG